jgi:hypothetical protein
MTRPRRLRAVTAVTAVLATVVAAGALAATAGPATAHGSGAHGSGTDGQAHSPQPLTAEQRRVIHQATKQFRDPAAAVAAGYLPTDHCTFDPEQGGMGYHYVDLAAVMDPAVDPAPPDILVYVPTQDGGRTLGAAEWIGIDPDQDVATGEGRPDLFGHPFDGPMLGHEPGMPVHFDLHVWLYKHNPAGMLTPFNPAVRC